MSVAYPSLHLLDAVHDTRDTSLLLLTTIYEDKITRH